MADPVTWMAVISMVSTAASGAVSYVGAQRNAKAQDYAADAAEAQGNYNATIASNNAQGRVNDLAFQESQLALGKNTEMQRLIQTLLKQRTCLPLKVVRLRMYLNQKKL
jgi:hypothetical protein